MSAAATDSKYQTPKSTIFISHANPEDNYFATWLATKLSLLGYGVWCDTEELKGGEDFWRDIEQTIRTQTIKFLFVITHRSLEKDGTRKELAVADRIKDRGDFIIPLRLEAVPHNTFPTEFIRLNAIDFSSNWSTGLLQLLEKLESDATPRKHSFASEQIRHWWRNSIGGTTEALLNREERYWSNWFACELPQVVYLHHVRDRKLATQNLTYPAILVGEYLISFACEKCIGDTVSISSTVPVKLETFLEKWKYEVTSSTLIVKKTDAKINELVNLTFNKYAQSKGLRSYEIAEGTVLYFPPQLHNGASTTRVKLDRYGLTHVSLNGESSGNRWHYALQGRAIMNPQPILWMSHHIVFTIDDIPVDKVAQHRLRRKVGSDWYNKQWRDRLLAAMLLLADSNTATRITMPVCCEQNICLPVEPIQLISSIGYVDPQ